MDGGKSLPLTPAGSMLLDVLRFAAAMAVVLGHFTHPGFSSGWPYRLDLALDGVGVFFVLSGFVIRLITTVRPVSARDYAIDRASRIYSVVLPSILFTLLAGIWIGRVQSPWRALLEIGANLTFTAQCWGLDIPVATNSVFWSLCYECAYYALYGFAFFARGRRRVLALLVLALLAGPPILSMLPLWLLGCALHDVYQRLRGQPLRHALYVTLGSAILLVTASFLRPLLPSLQHALAPAYWAIHSSSREWHLHLLMRADPRFYWVGVPLLLVLLAGLLALEHFPLSADSAVVRRVRFVADGTFALYLLHIPLLWLIAAFVPYDHRSIPQQAAVVSAVVVLCILAQRPMEWLKRRLRKSANMRKLAPAAFNRASLTG